MTKAFFTDSSTITVIAKDGEKFTLNPRLPIFNIDDQQHISMLLEKFFDERFENDKASMVYWASIDANVHGFSFSYAKSDRSEERERIGARIRLLREKMGMSAKQLAVLVNIDAANLSRIEQGRYSIGLDILSIIGKALGAKVELVEL